MINQHLRPTDARPNSWRWHSTSVQPRTPPLFLKRSVPLFLRPPSTAAHSPLYTLSKIYHAIGQRRKQPCTSRTGTGTAASLSSPKQQSCPRMQPSASQPLPRGTRIRIKYTMQDGTKDWFDGTVLSHTSGVKYLVCYGLYGLTNARVVESLPAATRGINWIVVRFKDKPGSFSKQARRNACGKSITGAAKTTQKRRCCAPPTRNKVDPNIKKCLVGECTSEAVFRNLCSDHSKDAKLCKKNEGVLTFGRVKKYCKDTSCNSLEHTSGLCKKHYRGI